MRIKLLLFVTAVMAFGLAGRPALADVTVAGQGTVKAVNTKGTTSTTCTAPGAITFAVSGSTFLFQETFGAGADTRPQACVPLVDGPYTNAVPGTRLCPAVVVPTTTMTRSGSTYTINSPAVECSGAAISDTITLTINATTIGYKHDLTQSGVHLVVTGTLTRVA